MRAFAIALVILAATPAVSRAGIDQSAAAPQTLSLSPNRGANTGPQTVLAKGSGYQAGATAKLVRSGAADIVGSNVLVTGDTALTVTFDLTDAPGGVWGFTVRNPDSLMSLPFTFQVIVTPVIDSITPRSGSADESIHLTIYGRRFLPNSRALFIAPSGSGYSFLSVVTDSTRMDADINLSTISAGVYDVRVINQPGGATGTLPAAFTVTPVPRLTSVTPDFGVDTTPTQLVRVNGTDLLPGALVSLVKGPTVLTANEVNVSVNRNSLMATFDLRGAPYGLYDVEVRNTDGKKGRLEAVFRVDLVPIVTALAPATGTDFDLQPITVIGGHFTQGCEFRLFRGTVAFIAAEAETMTTSGTRLTGMVDLRGAGLGSWHVRVTNAQNTASTEAFNVFTVLPGPRIAGIAPESSEPSLDVLASVSGSGFLSGAQVTLEHTGLPDIEGSDEAVDVAGSSISVRFDLAGSPLGRRDVVVRNPNGHTVTLAGAFEVIPGPSVVAVSPASAPDTGLAMVTMTGSGFAPGLQTWLSRSGQPDIPGTAVLVAGNGTAAQASFDLRGTALGAWDVVVENPSLQRSVLPASFEVVFIGPTFASGLDLTWDACNLPTSGGASSATLDCGNPAFVRSLYGNFQSPRPVPDFVALDAVIDIETGAAVLPAFWQFDPGGCNANGLLLRDQKPATPCPTSSNRNPWGSGGGAADAFITAYVPGINGASHARLLLTVLRSSTDPFSIEGGVNHYGFHLTWTGDLTQCDGCATPAEITWTSALLHSAGSRPPVFVTGMGERSNVASVNGGLSGLGLTAVVPDRTLIGTIATVRVLGRELGGVTELALTYPGRPDIPASSMTIDPDGRALTCSFDVSSSATGKWSVRAQAGASAVDLSQGLRLISRTPEVRVISPNGGEVVPTGRDNVVTWDAVDDQSVTTVDFWISRNGYAGPWELISTDQGGTGSGTYRVHGASSDFSLFRIVAHDADGNTGMDESDDYFTIGTPTATLLARFEAVGVTDGVEVSWRFMEPGRVARAELDRAPADAGPWAPVQAVHRTNDGETVVQDRSATASSRYRLRAVTRDGELLTFGPISLTAGDASPKLSGVTAIMPNPATSRARLQLAVAREDRVRVTVMDLMGREVSVLVDGVLPPGRHELTWDARSDGRALPAGLYFVRYVDRSREQVTRLVLAP